MGSRCVYFSAMEKFTNLFWSCTGILITITRPTWFYRQNKNIVTALTTRLKLICFKLIYWKIKLLVISKFQSIAKGVPLPFTKLQHPSVLTSLDLYSHSVISVIDNLLTPSVKSETQWKWFQFVDFSIDFWVSWCAFQWLHFFTVFTSIRSHHQQCWFCRRCLYFYCCTCSFPPLDERWFWSPTSTIKLF